MASDGSLPSLSGFHNASFQHTHTKRLTVDGDEDVVIANGTHRVAAQGTGGVTRHTDVAIINDPISSQILSAAMIKGGIVKTVTTVSPSLLVPTDTAAHILAAYPKMVVGETADVLYVNASGYPVLLTNGTGVTSVENGVIITTLTSRLVRFRCTAISPAAFVVY
jgi:hypothetical protein